MLYLNLGNSYMSIYIYENSLSYIVYLNLHTFLFFIKDIYLFIYFGYVGSQLLRTGFL